METQRQEEQLYKNKEGLTSTALERKNANRGGEGDGGSLILFNMAIIHSQFCP
jgi:hypothetical protein